MRAEGSHHSGMRPTAPVVIELVTQQKQLGYLRPRPHGKLASLNCRRRGIRSHHRMLTRRSAGQRSSPHAAADHRERDSVWAGVRRDEAPETPAGSSRCSATSASEGARHVSPDPPPRSRWLVSRAASGSWTSPRRNLTGSSASSDPPAEAAVRVANRVAKAVSKRVDPVASSDESTLRRSRRDHKIST